MRMHRLWVDDDAVSPVIGVILMVAITVILAAVIATFVLGLGDSITEAGPQASFATEFEETGSDNDGQLEIEHTSGDRIIASDLLVRGQNGTEGQGNGDAIDTDWKSIVNGGLRHSDGSASSDKSGESAVVSGDQIEFDIATDGEIDLIYQGSRESSSTLAEWSGPDA